ncbi:MAG: M48 family metallopeptidase [Granulosicoccus sp.]
MTEIIELGDLSIAVTRKAIKNVHLTVHPPHGRVTLSAPLGTRLEVARAYAITKLGWIRKQQKTLADQARETPRQFVEGESHWLWGRRYILTVTEKESVPSVSLDHKRIRLYVRPGSTLDKRAQVLYSWQKSLLHESIPPLVERWESKLGVQVSAYYLQRMKTRWGSCNSKNRSIRLNTELVKKPRDLLGYVVVHEMVHLIEPTHSEKFGLYIINGGHRHSLNWFCDKSI